ncbi:hypothetical protein [Marinobacter gelidimuriae]|uniref:hypothetical protein n=1 Tax=Marinobacter gelidimuriae TaxID=2739064 RepID=UPI0003747558|nr:hypothetical protein [Marinobacter gelidimuriae]
MIQYLFRKPKYPVLIETDERVMGARSGERIGRLCNQSSFDAKESYIVIDSSGEGWSFFPAHEVISPLTTQKRWTKAKIIELFNASLAGTGNDAHYEPGSLSSRRLEQIVREIVEHESKL